MYEPLYDQSRFTYELPMVEGGLQTTVKNLETGEDKVFFNAGWQTEWMPQMANHLNSLTDELMESWFRKRDKKGKK